MQPINLISILCILAFLVVCLSTYDPLLPDCADVWHDNWKTINMDDGTWVIDGVRCER